MRKEAFKGRPLFWTRWQEDKQGWRRAPGLIDALQVICPDKWKDGSNNNTEGGGRKVNENKALSKKKRYISLCKTCCFYHRSFYLQGSGKDWCCAGGSHMQPNARSAKAICTKMHNTARHAHIRRAYVLCAGSRY